MGGLVETAKDFVTSPLSWISPTTGATATAGKAIKNSLRPVDYQTSSQTQPKEAVMPIPDDEASKAAKRRALAAQRQRGGRQSTILSALGNETLG